MASQQTLGVAPSWVDFDRDGDLDAFVPESDVGTVNSRIWVNTGSAAFTPLNVGLPRVAGGAAHWGDFDNDGDPDCIPQ